MTVHEKKVDDLEDGDVFSADGGETWHTCAVVLYGNVACYLPGEVVGDDNAMTTRYAVDRDETVMVKT